MSDGRVVAVGSVAANSTGARGGAHSRRSRVARAGADPAPVADGGGRDGLRLCVSEVKGQSAEDEPGAKRGDERGKMQRDREEAVHPAAHKAEDQAKDDRQQRRHAQVDADLPALARRLTPSPVNRVRRAGCREDIMW